MTMVLFQVIQVGHWWNIFSFTQIHDEVNEIWGIGRRWLGQYRDTWIHFNIIQHHSPAISPVEKTPPFLEKTFFHHLQAEDSTFAFTEPKAQDVESEVWWPWGRGRTKRPNMGGSLVVGQTPPNLGSFRLKKTLSSKKARQPSERKIPPT